jgi:hypothetical protein
LEFQINLAFKTILYHNGHLYYALNYDCQLKKESKRPNMVLLPILKYFNVNAIEIQTKSGSHYRIWYDYLNIN